MKATQLSDTPAPLARVGLAESGWRKQFAGFYQSQGLAEGSQRSSNDCGPAAAAMLAAYWRARINLPSADGLFAGMKAGLIPGLERIPAPPRTGWRWLDALLLAWRQRAGATAPWGVASALRAHFSGSGLRFTATWRSRCTAEDLDEELAAGRPCAALLVWPRESGSGGHWVVVVGRSPGGDLIYLLDPDPAMETRTGADRVRQVEWAWFERYWGMGNWWSRLLGLRRVLVRANHE